METRNPKMKRKHSMEMEPCKERKSIKISTCVVSTQDIKPLDPGDDKTSRKNQDLVIIYTRKEKNLEKAPGPGNNGSPKSCAAAADEKQDKAPLKFTILGNSACNETEQKDQEGCVAASPKLEARAGLENGVRVRQDPSSHSREKLLHKEMEKRRERESLKAGVAQLKDEINLLCCQIQKCANKCMQLSEANRLLLDELKKVLDPSGIEILEAKNPDPEYRRNPQNEETTPSEPSPD